MSVRDATHDFERNGVTCPHCGTFSPRELLHDIGGPTCCHESENSDLYDRYGPRQRRSVPTSIIATEGTE